MDGTNIITHSWDKEYIVAARWVELKDMETGQLVGVAYRNNDKIVTEILHQREYNVAVKLFGDFDDDITWSVHHVFVERYIKYVLKRGLEEVEIYRIHIAHGDFDGERPGDVLGEVIAHVQESAGKEGWFTMEHLSGPILADSQSIVSHFTAGRLSRISAKIPQNLIPNRLSYIKNPQDLPLLGVIITSDATSMLQKNYEDNLIRLKKPKIPRIN